MSGIVLGLAFLGGLVTAWVIGANSAAPSFGPVRSAGAVNVFRGALIVGISAFAGAVLQGGTVADTMGNGLVMGVTFSPLLAAIVLWTGSLLILGSVIMNYPMPTAFTVVASVIGTGIAAGGVLDSTTFARIIGFWVVVPFVAAGIGYGTASLFRRFVARTEGSDRAMKRLLLVLGVYTAFTAGANQSGLIVGPLLNTVSFDPLYLLVFAGAGMVIGALTGSPRIITAVSQEYSRMGPRRAIAALLSASVIAQAGTIIGVPVSFNEAIIASVIGSGLVEGRAGVSAPKLGWTVIGWIGAFVVAVGVSWGVTTMVLAVT